MELVRIDAQSGRMTGVLASPRIEGPRPAVIVIHEVLGLNDDMREKAQRLADMGYVALAPDLYSTRGRKPFCVFRTLRGLGKGEGPVFRDLDACRSWLGGRPEVDASKIGVIGFCMGGGVALLFAARGRLGAAAVFDGAVPKDAEDLSMVCPVVAGFGGRDRIFGNGGAKLSRHLSLAGQAQDIRTYPDAGHGYLSQHSGWVAKAGAWGPMNVGFNPEAAEDSWRRVEQFFGEHLGGQLPDSGDVSAVEGSEEAPDL
ncbi:MAG: dienelactone hydrolase family protein [bacterium]